MPAYLAWRSRVSWARLRTSASRLPWTKRGRRSRQLGVERAVAGQVALVEQADVQLDIVVVHLGAFVRRAHGVADAQPGVPQALQKRGDGLLVAAPVPLGFEQQQQIDIGIGKQLAAAVAAHGEHRDAGRQQPEQQCVGGLQHQPVHLGGALGQRGQRIAGRQEGLASNARKHVSLEGRFTTIVVPDADGFGHVVDEDLAVADLAGARGGGQGS